MSNGWLYYWAIYWSSYWLSSVQALLYALPEKIDSLEFEFTTAKGLWKQATDRKNNSIQAGARIGSRLAESRQHIEYLESLLEENGINIGSTPHKPEDYSSN
ncbi:hypothetical protein JCM19239_6820 [Vibrio variabilis]|uniref:Uncharacterized protein n=1 Tax=Vibrio variabilis TaxID=990271 RepID=A0ABQ0JN43_9VIBR|nr:hypothetical protein JCM19239_6820 [Vibrio variabilis]